MKRIIAYKNIFGITQETNLSELKSMYRNLMKDSHPDKIIDDEAKKIEAEHHSKKIIEAYHFLVSVSPETHARHFEEYTEITENSIIENYEYKGQTLTIYFHDGSSYEYFGVPRNVYFKFINSNTLSRFAKRHIFHTYLYRNITKKVDAA